MEQNNQSYECPACGCQESAVFLSVNDHFLSKEDFVLRSCTGCTLVYTTPRPERDLIGEYYKSEEYISHSSTKKGLINALYNRVRNYTLNQKVKLVQQLVSGKQLLDIGAGTGHFLKRAKESGFNVLGLEPDSDARNVAYNENGITLQAQDVLHSLPGETYDAITMWHVLEHVYDLRTDTERIASLVKKNGVLIIAVPNYTSYDAEYYGSYWAAYDVPRHLYHFSPSSIVPFIQQFGFQLEKQLPMRFDAYYVSMLSEKYKGGSLLKALFSGWKSNRRAGNDKSSSQIYIFRRK